MSAHRARTLVIGSGVAGLYTAWRAARQGEVVLLTKRTLADSNTAYAQGGIAAALGAGDSPALHRRDTLAAGAALCDARAVEVLVTEGPARVRELAAAGAHFDRTADGALALGREAAHSEHRIVHAHGDQTGAEIVATLAARVRATPAITVLETARALELLIEDGACVGALVLHDGALREIRADATVLATGGAGQVYRYTTNPAVATGDGLVLALQAGAALADLEFVQFHPTALDTPETPLVLISEAVRGEGAVLVNERGERFMPTLHPLADLAPRDIVARAVFREREQTGRVYLDATRLGAGFEHRFPGIAALCRARGLDPRTDPLPVTPAAHFIMGGVVTDLAGRSTIPRLYAAGEVARTGVHGANRLASNSLLEGLVFAARVAEDLGSRDGGWEMRDVRAHDGGRIPHPASLVPRAALSTRIQSAMWRHAGLLRTAAGLRACLAELEAIEREIPRDAIDERNLLTVGRLIARSALLREESRGGHFRTDFPRARRGWERRHVRTTVRRVALVEDR